MINSEFSITNVETRPVWIQTHRINKNTIYPFSNVSWCKLKILTHMYILHKPLAHGNSNYLKYGIFPGSHHFPSWLSWEEHQGASSQGIHGSTSRRGRQEAPSQRGKQKRTCCSLLVRLQKGGQPFSSCDPTVSCKIGSWWKHSYRPLLEHS